MGVRELWMSVIPFGGMVTVGEWGGGAWAGRTHCHDGGGLDESGFS